MERKDETVARKQEETENPLLGGEEKRRGQCKRVPQGKSPGVINMELVKQGKLRRSALPPGRFGPRGCWSSAAGYGGLQSLRPRRLHVPMKPCASSVLRDLPVSTLILGATNCLAFPCEWVYRLRQQGCREGWGQLPFGKSEGTEIGMG